MISQRLHQLIAKVNVGDSSIIVSIDLTINTMESTFKTLYTEVDNALYKAKEFGRNRTELYN